MKIKCWGCRGSIPVSGKDYNKFGGDTTCFEIRANNRLIVIDAGTGIRRLGQQLIKEKIKDINLFFTHAHLDHIIGFPYFKPLFFSDKNINIYAPNLGGKDLKNILKNIMSPPLFPINLDQSKANLQFFNIVENKSWFMDGLKIEPISLNHPGGGVGYKFTHKEKTIVFLTDNNLDFLHEGGKIFEQYVVLCKGANLLLHDAEFSLEEYEKKKDWGHSSYISALNLAIKARVKKFGLIHHNQNRSDEEIGEIVRKCKKIILEKKSKLDCFALFEGWEINL